MNKYVYYSMGTNHFNADDVAITEAVYIEDAIDKFKKYYTDASEENVRLVEFNRDGIMFVSDY